MIGALSGGPAREPLCYARIVGLSVATGPPWSPVSLLCPIFVPDPERVTWQRG